MVSHWFRSYINKFHCRFAGNTSDLCAFVYILVKILIAWHFKCGQFHSKFSSKFSLSYLKLRFDNNRHPLKLPWVIKTCVNEWKIICHFFSHNDNVECMTETFQWRIRDKAKKRFFVRFCIISCWNVTVF